GIGQGFYTALQGGLGSAKQIQAMAEAIKAIKAIKALRPKAKVGFYGIPTRFHPTAPTLLKPLFDVSDAVYPSLYEWYKVGTDITVATDAQRVGLTMTIALQAARGKPVYPFVSEIYYNNLSYDGDIMPTSEF